MYQEAISPRVFSSHPLTSPALRVGRFRFVIAPKETLFVPAVNKGNMLRGGFGHAFRRLCCVPECRDSRSCPIGSTCPYKAIFEPSPPRGAESLSANHDIPRPFVFRASQTRQTRFETGRPFQFELVLIGGALDYLPYFVLAFRELGEEGLGLNRAKCRLEKVEQLDLSTGRDLRQSGPVLVDAETTPGPRSHNGTAAPNRQPTLIYSSEDQFFHAAQPCETSDWIKQRLEEWQPTQNNGAAHEILIRFLTPTLLKSKGEIIRQPDFHHVFKRLRDRINALNTFFGEAPIDADFKGLGERAEQIRTVFVRTEWVERSRTSSKTGQRHELSGFIGEASYEGNLKEFLPWLRMAELVHIGKHTAWGQGWVRLSLMLS